MFLHCFCSYDCLGLPGLSDVKSIHINSLYIFLIQFTETEYHLFHGMNWLQHVLVFSQTCCTDKSVALEFLVSEVIE